MKKMTKREKRMARHRRVRSRIRGSADCPRLSIFRSGRALTVQLIDDAAGRTLVAVRDSEVPDPEGKKKYTRVERAHAAGALAAHRALQKGIAAVVFDRGGYAYHGLVRSVAEGARKGGLKL
ncbi:MAG: 50S ribosomal protein L18 [Candidatus Sungbacteria bacterium]|nr:50S ribosomal protein L18 [Candidatus Sungbacteria bacterium]